MQPRQQTIAEGGRRPRTQRCKWPCNIWACRTSQLLYEASPRTVHRNLSDRFPHQPLLRGLGTRQGGTDAIP